MFRSSDCFELLGKLLTRLSKGHFIPLAQKHAPLGGPSFPNCAGFQESSDTGAPVDVFAEKRLLIFAQSHIPVGGKLQFFLHNWQVIKASKCVVR